MRTMHLFAGVGGGLLADLILGHTPIVAVEWEPYACQVLRERAADGWFPGLRVWEGDVRLFDPSEYAGSVDCIHAGFPCQDISVAGNQAGVGHETRSGLYREVLRIAGIIRPRYLFLENVSAILGNGLGTVLADLAAMGFSAEWGCIRASDCGAPHHRDRWFLLADSIMRSKLDVFGEQRSGTEQHESSKCGSLLSDSARAGLEGEGIRKLIAECSEKDVPNAICGGQPEQRPSRNAINTEKASEGETVDAFNGSFDGIWTTEPDVGRVANGVPARIHRLKGLGNAQVPLQAAVAWKLLGGE